MSKTVSELMSTELVTAYIPGTREQVLKKMHTERVSCVPILERDDDELVGIITRSDLLKGGEEEQIALIMTRDPVVAERGDSVESAVEALLENDIRRLPVVEDGELVGMLSVADVVGEIDSDESVADYYHDTVCAIWRDTPIPVAALTMRLAREDAAMILDEEGGLAGILSDTDLVRSASIDDFVRSNNLGSGEEDDDWTWEGIKDNIMIYHGVSRIDFPKGPVTEIMTSDVVTKYGGSAASDAASDMAENEIEQIPVVNKDNEVVGLLRDRDLLPLLI